MTLTQQGRDLRSTDPKNGNSHRMGYTGKKRKGRRKEDSNPYPKPFCSAMYEEISELSKRGQEIFERVVGPQVEDEDDRKFVAIDVESEDFEVGENQVATAKRLMERQPDAEGRIWFRRVGSRVTHHLRRGLQEEGEE